MATLTSTLVEKPVPRAVHAGVNSITAEYDGAVTIGDVVLLAPLPNGATVLDVIGGAGVSLDIGVQGDTSAFAAAVTAGAVGRASVGVPYTVSVSDDQVANRFINLVAEANSALASAGIKVTVLYTMDK